jgi:hypothetical protein
MLNVATFGSCLSRYTANALFRMFPVSLLSCVFHNRSDAFLNNYVRGAYQLPEFDTLAERLVIDARHRGTMLQSIMNQYPEGIGLHNLQNGVPFMKALDEESLDLIILDNYMDITPVLKTPVWEPDKHFFVNTAHIQNAKEAFKPGGHQLSIIEMMQNWTEIIRFIQKKQPQAALVFMHFPYNLYANERRHARCKRFEQVLNPKLLPECLIIKNQFIVPRYMDGTARHYTEPQYTFYAGMIYQYMAALGRPIGQYQGVEYCPEQSYKSGKRGLKDLVNALFAPAGSL